MEIAPVHGDSRESRLLSLPPEIRNIIYRYALVDGKMIYIRYPHNLTGAPGVLQVNRQLRSETVDIYYKENTFNFYIHHYSPEGLMKWCGSSEARLRCKKNFHFVNYRDMVWTNLLKWLRAYYHHRVTGIGLPANYSSGTDVAAARLFEMVYKWRAQGLTIEAVEERLEEMHLVLAAMDSSGLRW